MNADSKLPSFSEWTAQIQQRTEVALLLPTNLNLKHTHTHTRTHTHTCTRHRTLPS